MDFLGIGPLELLFIIIIAIVVFGPRDIAKTGKTAGRLLNQLFRSDGWRMFNEASNTLRTLPNRLAREAALDELDAVRQSVKETSEQVAHEATQMDASMRAWTKPEDPTPPGEQHANSETDPDTPPKP